MRTIRTRGHLLTTVSLHGLGVCSTSSAHQPGIAVPLGTVHPLGGNTQGSRVSLICCGVGEGSAGRGVVSPEIVCAGCSCLRVSGQVACTWVSQDLGVYIYAP